MTQIADKRRALIAAARVALIEGDGAFEITEVARKAGVSAGLAYHHFGSKSGLIEAIVNEFYDRYDAVITEDFGRGRPWFAREATRLEKVVAFLFAEPLAPILLTRLSAQPEIAKVEADRRAKIVALAAENMRRAQGRGEIEGSIDPELAASFVNGGLRDAVACWLEAGLPRDPARFVAATWPLVQAALEPRGGTGSAAGTG